MKWELIREGESFERREGYSIISFDYCDEAIDPVSVQYYVHKDYMKEFIDENLGLKIGNVEEVNNNVLIKILATLEEYDGVHISIELDYYLDIIMSPISIGFIHHTEGVA